MNPPMKNILLAISLALFFTMHGWTHPDKVEDRLVFHFATGAHPPTQKEWEDLTHQFKATVHGAPKLTNIGSALALRLNGPPIISPSRPAATVFPSATYR